MVDISVNNLTKFFVIGENLLEGLTFDIQEGECVAILGRNGCGKTTLFNILTGQMDYDDGEVYVDLDTLLKTSDVVSLHCPLFPETQGMISAEAIAKMLSRKSHTNSSRYTLTQRTGRHINTRNMFFVGVPLQNTSDMTKSF